MSLYWAVDLANKIEKALPKVLIIKTFRKDHIVIVELTNKIEKALLKVLVIKTFKKDHLNTVCHCIEL